MRDKGITIIAALLVGAILLFISEFLDVFGGYSNYQLVFSNSSFLFPLVAGILTMISAFLIYYSKILKQAKNLFILALIFGIIGLLLNMQYLIFILSEHTPYIWNYLSIYVNFLGFLTSIFTILLVLVSEHD